MKTDWVTSCIPGRSVPQWEADPDTVEALPGNDIDHGEAAS